MIAAEFLADRDDGLGDGRVRVAEPGGRPRPRRIGGGLTDDDAGRVEQSQRAGMAGPWPEYLGGAERRECHGMGVGRTYRCARVEQGPGLLADPRGGTAGRGGAQGPQRPAPGILRFGRAVPAAVDAKAAAELAVCRLSLGEEVKVAAAQGDELGGR